jgi:hypothetical protein
MLDRLRLIRNSLELEQESARAAGRSADYYEDRLVSDKHYAVSESIREGSVSESRRKDIVGNQGLMEEARTFSDEMKKLPTSQYPYGKLVYPPELKDALKSVGISVLDPIKNLDQLLNERENELRMEVPGGLEEMVGEFI